MQFKKININNWNRKEYFEHYFSNIPCTYSMTIKLDITKIKSKNIKLYPTMLYYITNIVNKHDEFKTAFNENNELGIYDEMIPCYTIFHKDTKTFSNIWTKYTPNINDFYDEYENDLKQYGNKKELNAKPNIPSNIFNVSMIPWTTFESFNLNLQKGYTYLSPIFTLGRYYKADERFLMPLYIQVHHAVCDGFHVCQFLNELQDLINK